MPLWPLAQHLCPSRTLAEEVSSIISMIFELILQRWHPVDMVAAVGETTAAGPVLPRLLDHMLESEEGRRILKERPRINTNSIDMAALARLPENTFGRTYVTWLERCGVTPDTRGPVRPPHIHPHNLATAFSDHADHARCTTSMIPSSPTSCSDTARATPFTMRCAACPSRLSTSSRSSRSRLRTLACRPRHRQPPPPFA